MALKGVNDGRTVSWEIFIWILPYIREMESPEKTTETFHVYHNCFNEFSVGIYLESGLFDRTLVIHTSLFYDTFFHLTLRHFLPLALFNVIYSTLLNIAARVTGIQYVIRHVSLKLSRFVKNPCFTIWDVRHVADSLSDILFLNLGLLVIDTIATCMWVEFKNAKWVFF